MQYQHTVQYYETDQMGVVHHSNYVRWLEELRHDMLIRRGMPYDALEARGIIIPVLSVHLEYKRPARFGETVTVEGFVSEFTGVKFRLEYALYGDKGLLLTAQTCHGFIDEDFRPLRIKRSHPDVYELFTRMVAEKE